MQQLCLEAGFAKTSVRKDYAEAEAQKNQLAEALKPILA